MGAKPKDSNGKREHWEDFSPDKSGLTVLQPLELVDFPKGEVSKSKLFAHQSGMP